MRTTIIGLKLIKSLLNTKQKPHYSRIYLENLGIWMNMAVRQRQLPNHKVDTDSKLNTVT